MVGSGGLLGPGGPGIYRLRDNNLFGPGDPPEWRFSQADIGRWVEITSAANPNNNGVFQIVRQSFSYDLFIYIPNAGAASEGAGAMRWRLVKHITPGGVVLRFPTGGTTSTIFGSGTAQGVDDGSGLIAAPTITGYAEPTGFGIAADTPIVGTATLESFVGTFDATMIGRTITISGAVNPINNGSFPITGIGGIFGKLIEYTLVGAISEPPGAITFSISPGPLVGTIDYYTGALTFAESGTDVWGLGDDVDVDFRTTHVGDELTLRHAYGGALSIVDMDDATAGLNLSLIRGATESITQDTPVVGTATLLAAPGSFNPAFVGLSVRIRDAVNPANDGIFPITAQPDGPGATIEYTAPGAVTEGGLSNWVIDPPPPFAGTDSPDYSAIAFSFNGLLGFILRLLSPSTTGILADSSIQLHRSGADAQNEVFGLPKADTTLSGALVEGDAALACVDTSLFPVPEVNVIVAGPFDGTFVSLIPPSNPLTRPTAVEVEFGPFWDGGAIRVTGIDCHGDVVQELFEPPSVPKIVDSGSAAAGRGLSDPSSGTRLDVLGTPSGVLLDPAVKSGLLMEVLTGAAAGVRPIKGIVRGVLTPDTLQILLRSALPAAAANEDWRVLDTTVVPGVQLFKEITLVENLTAGTAVDAARVQVLDGPETYGYDIITGRGLRDSGDDGVVIPSLSAFFNPYGSGDNISFVAGTTFQLSSVGTAGPDTSAPGPFTPSMVGQNLILTNSTSPNNDGTFLITLFVDAQNIQYTNNTPGAAEPFPGNWQITGQYQSRLNDLNGYIRLSGGVEYAGANNGLHRITRMDAILEGLTLAYLRHEKDSKGERFASGDYVAGSGAAEPNLAWEVYSAGEVHRVLANVGNVLTIDGWGALGTGIKGLDELMELGRAVEVERDLAIEKRGEEVGLGQITVDVDLGMRPTFATPLTDPFLIESGDTSGSGGSLPDGWKPTNVAASTSGMVYPAFFNPLRQVLDVSVGGVDAELFRDVPLVAERYVGFQIRASFWVQWHGAAAQDFRLDVSFDGGATFVAGTPLSVSPTVGGTVGGGSLDPIQITEVLEVPYNATSCIVKLVVVAPPLASFSVERVMVTATHATGLFLGSNTIIRSDKRSLFGELLYIWSPEDLGASENEAIGIPTAPNSLPDVLGHIDYVVNAHGLWERFDISEYSGVDPVNVKGIYDETAWTTAALTNMELVIGTPPRLTFVRPSLVSLVEGEELGFVGTITTLAVISIHEGPYPEESGQNDLLLEDGVPVPATPPGGSVTLPWRFLGTTSMQIEPTIFDSSADYVLDYEALIRAESPVIDLGASFADYLWLADARFHRRLETDIVQRVLTVQLLFRTDFKAELELRSDQDRATSVLTKDDGRTRTSVPQANWRYETSQLVVIDSAVFDPDSIYTLEYNSISGTQTRPTSVVIEVRSGTTAAGAQADTYREAQIDEIVDRSHQFHQMRVTFGDVVDVRDLRLGSMGFKGIRLYGANPYAPGIVTCG
jgi:hypothetical protein